MSKPRLHIAILHPTLGLGGAERLILQAAVALADAGHTVTIYVNAFDPDHAFPEAKAENLTIRQSFAWLPAHIGGRFRILCACLRMTCLVLGLAFKKERVDLFITDLLPHVVPLLRRLFTEARQVIYCHYPDQLLTPPQRGWYRWYRRPWNRLEVKSYTQVDLIMTNSHYTRGTLERLLKGRQAPPVKVVHPGVAIPEGAESTTEETRHVVLCLGRFHPSKNQRLALEAFALMLTELALPHPAPYRLVFAGGYDEGDKEGRNTFKMLEVAIREKRLEDRVSLCPNVTDEALEDLWNQSLVLVFPPEEEHFGIAPLEAMVRGIPVIAADRGGPTETIHDGRTGFLRPPTAMDFAAALTRLLKEPARRREMGRMARKHVEAHFALGIFSATFAAHVAEVCQGGRPIGRHVQPTPFES